SNSKVPGSQPSKMKLLTLPSPLLIAVQGTPVSFVSGSNRGTECQMYSIEISGTRNGNPSGTTKAGKLFWVGVALMKPVRKVRTLYAGLIRRVTHRENSQPT